MNWDIAAIDKVLTKDVITENAVARSRFATSDTLIVFSYSQAFDRAEAWTRIRKIGNSTRGMFFLPNENLAGRWIPKSDPHTIRQIEAVFAAVPGGRFKKLPGLKAGD